MKKIKDKIIIANTVSLVFISFIIILSMTIFLIHTAVEAETKEMDKLLPTVIKRLDEVPDYKLKETYRNYDYADKEYISLAVEKNGEFIYLSDDKDSFKLKKFESNKLKIKWDRFIYKKIYAGQNAKYYAIRNFEFMEAHELLYVMLAMFVLITISIIIISKIVAEHVLTPLSNIISQSNEMSKHNIDLQLTKTRDDEIGELIDVLNFESITNEPLEIKAKEFNAYYKEISGKIMNFPEEDISIEEQWNSLSNIKKDSSRSQCMHQNVKEVLLAKIAQMEGFSSVEELLDRWKAMVNSVSVKEQINIIEKNSAMNYMSALEHKRWSSFYYMKNFVYSEKKDEVNCTHNSLIDDWDEFLHSDKREEVIYDFISVLSVK